MRKILKNFIRVWPWPLTRNERYDRETKALIGKICDHSSVCVDAGCYQGEILEVMMKFARGAKHFAFEPIPHQYRFLKEKFGDKARVFPYALGEENNVATFHYVKTNPTYSGLLKREYVRDEVIEQIIVEVRKLDDVVQGEKIRLIKIDVEGGEYGVLKGAYQTLHQWKPYIIFEHGLGGADKYGTTPEMMYSLLAGQHQYKICLMDKFLKGQSSGMSLQQFQDQFWHKKNCYFIAVP